MTYEQLTRRARLRGAVGINVRFVRSLALFDSGMHLFEAETIMEIPVFMASRGGRLVLGGRMFGSRGELESALDKRRPRTHAEAEV